MRWLKLIVVVVACATSAAAKDYPPNELPMYGGITKTHEMVLADEAFIQAALKGGHTRAEASDMVVLLGWKYLRQGDLATAMKRFNQAWLLDPDNGDAFHGFAAMTFSRDHDAAAADKLFREGVGKPRQKPGIFLDYGRFLLMTQHPSEAVPVLKKALSFSDMGPEAEALLVIALSQMSDKAAACAELPRVQMDTQQKPIAEQLQSIAASCAKK